MNLYIELLIPLAVIALFFIWALWKNITDWFYAWSYKRNNDKNKRGKELGGGKLGIESTTNDISRPSQPGEPELLQTTDVNSVREDSSIFGKPSFFSRFKRKSY
jgi:hypothetical protein